MTEHNIKEHIRRVLDGAGYETTPANIQIVWSASDWEDANTEDGLELELTAAMDIAEASGDLTKL